MTRQSIDSARQQLFQDDIWLLRLHLLARRPKEMRSQHDNSRADKFQF